LTKVSHIIPDINGQYYFASAHFADKVFPKVLFWLSEKWSLPCIEWIGQMIVGS